MEMFLTTRKFGSLMDTNFRREPPRVVGFPTKAASARKRTSPAMAQVAGAISEVCCALSEPFFRSFEHPRLAFVVPKQGMPRHQERSNLQLVGPAKSAGPMQSREECCKRSAVRSR